MFDQAFQLDGIDDVATADAAALPTGSSDRTIAFWVSSPHLEDADGAERQFEALRTRLAQLDSTAEQSLAAEACRCTRSKLTPSSA